MQFRENLFSLKTLHEGRWAQPGQGAGLRVLGERAPALAEACVRQQEGRDAETTCLRIAQR